MGGTPLRAAAVEAALVSGASTADAAAHAAEGTSAAADIRASRAYREHLARVLVSRALARTPPTIVTPNGVARCPARAHNGSCDVAQGAQGPGRWIWSVRRLMLLAGALPVLSFPAANLEFLAWFGLVPGLVLIVRSPSAREGGIRAWWLGAGYLIAALYWMTPEIGPGRSCWWPRWSACCGCRSG